VKEVARLGFIGLGQMGRDLLSAAVKNSRAEVVGLCDRSETALEQADAIIRAAGKGDAAHFADHREMLRELVLDGVVVGAPQYLHATLCIDALEAGCTTFCEKPMALTVTDGRAMITAAKQAGKGLMVGQVLRYIGPYRYVLESACSGELGRPLAMRTSRTMSGFRSSTEPWRLRRETSGGILFEVNIHEVDLMLNILGPAAEVRALGKNFCSKDVDYEDFITIQVAFQNGCMGNLTSVYCDFVGQNSGEVYLDRGTIYYNSRMKQVLVGREGGEVLVQEYDGLPADWEPGVVREVREFIEACLGERAVTIPGEDGLRALEICEAAYLSAGEGGRIVPLPLA